MGSNLNRRKRRRICCGFSENNSRRGKSAVFRDPLVDCCGYAELQQLSELGSGHGAAEEVTLTLGTAAGLKESELFLRFDALGDDALIEVLSHVDDGADDGRIVGVAGDLVNKGLVNLEGVDGKLAEIAEAGIAGAEVVHGKVYPHFFETLQHGGRGLDVVHKDAFGEFQIETAGFQASFRECCPDTFDKTLIAKLNGGNIDGNVLERQARVLPCARPLTGFV